MKNKEKFLEEILSALNDVDFCPSAVSKTYPCMLDKKDCEKCVSDWLEEEYIEPIIDLSKVEVDTPLLVRDEKTPKWFRRHFAEVDDDGKVATFASGRTSWTKYGVLESWRFAKLAESED